MAQSDDHEHELAVPSSAEFLAFSTREHALFRQHMQSAVAKYAETGHLPASLFSGDRPPAWRPARWRAQRARTGPRRPAWGGAG
jgi:hypothetical protein